MAVAARQRAVFEGQRVFLSRKCLPPQLIGTLQDVLKDSGATVCVFSDPSCNASTDFHVLASFQNEKFEELQAKGCNVVGPECVLRCAKDRRPLPSQKYACCIAMDGVGVLVTGFSPKEKEDLQHVVIAMCGQLQDDPAQVNFVVAKDVCAAKYKCALKWHKPVLSVDWIHQCSKEHRLVPTGPYRLQPFAGLNICVTNIAPDVRKEIAARTVEHGGHFSGSLTRDCTHLIAKSPEGDKYKVAKFWTHVKLVNEQWFWQSIEAKACLEESLFPVCASGITQPIQVKVTEPIPETAPTTELLSSPFVQSAAAQLKPKQNLISSQQEAPSFVPSTETKLQGAPRLDLQMEGEVDPYDGDGLYLSSCRVHLSGFTNAEEKRLLSMLFDGGATRFIEFNDNVTHIILGQPAESELKEIRRVMMWGAVHVVFPSWVFECTKQRQDVSTKDHLVSAESVLRGSAQAQGKSIERTVSNARTCSANRDNRTPAEVVGFVQESQHGKSGFASIPLPGEESLTLEISPRMGDLSANGAGKARLEERAKRVMQPPRSRSGLVTIPATQSELVEKRKGLSNSVFSGYVFGLLDPTPSQKRSEVINLIIHGGGCMERDVTLKKLDFVVFSHKTRQEAELYNGTAEVVSDIWIRHCAKDDKLLDIRDHILYQPLRTQLPLPGFEKYVLCPSQLKDKERELMAELCILLGGKFSEDLVRQVTHLILKVPEGDKYQGALRLDTVAIVSHDWLIACASENMIVSVDEYRVGKEVPSENLNGVPLSVGFLQGDEVPQSVAILQRNEIPQSVAIPQSNEIPQSVAIPQGTETFVECGPSMPEMSDVRVGASEGNQGTKSEIAATGSSQMVTRDASAGMKGKKIGARFKQPQQARPRSRGAEIRLSQGQNQGDSNLDPWDSIAAPWAPATSKPKKGKTSPESAKGSGLPRPATRSQQKLQPNTEDNPLPSNDTQIDNSTTSKPKVEKDTAVIACGESLKDSGESEGLAAAIEGLLETTIKVSASKRKGTRKTDADAALLSPERTRIRSNQDDSASQSEFKRAKPNWHRTRSSTGALNPSSSAQYHGTHDHFEETQMESQVAYEEDLAGRQLILEKVRTRSTTKATVRRPERSPKDSWKERLCRIADGNK